MSNIEIASYADVLSTSLRTSAWEANIETEKCQYLASPLRWCLVGSGKNEAQRKLFGRGRFHFSCRYFGVQLQIK